MQINFRKGTIGDVPQMGRLYRDAVSFMASQGLDQWQNGYPNESDAYYDVKRGVSRVLVSDDKLLGICVIEDYEPDYDVIYDGKWEGTSYVAVHRVAVSSEEKGKGIAGMLFSSVIEEAKTRGVSAVRIDTHTDNKPMRRALEKSGFVYRGIIYLRFDGAKRVAYEKLL